MSAGLFAGEDRWGDWIYAVGSTVDGWGGEPPYLTDENGEPIWREAEGVRATRPWTLAAVEAPTERIRRDTLWSVYGLVDRSGVMFYIGFTGYVAGRLVSHRNDRRWRERLCRLVVLERHTYKHDAHDAEVRLIREHSPEFNVRHKDAA